jgi:hypothetical protein
MDPEFPEDQTGIPPISTSSPTCRVVTVPEAVNTNDPPKISHAFPTGTVVVNAAPAAGFENDWTVAAIQASRSSIKNPTWSTWSPACIPSHVPTTLHPAGSQHCCNGTGTYRFTHVSLTFQVAWT